MKANALLEKQHRNVEAMLDDLENGQDPTQLLPRLAQELAAHMAIEQDIFYPAIRDIDPHLIEASFEEHSMAELALKRLLKTPSSDVQFLARVSMLKELIHHHVEEEEEELFPEVDKAVASERLEELGVQMERAFTDAQADGFDSLVPQTFAQTSADEALAQIASEARAGTPASANRGRTSSGRTQPGRH